MSSPARVWCVVSRPSWCLSRVQLAGGPTCLFSPVRTGSEGRGSHAHCKRSDRVVWTGCRHPSSFYQCLMLDQSRHGFLLVALVVHEGGSAPDCVRTSQVRPCFLLSYSVCPLGLGSLHVCVLTCPSCLPYSFMAPQTEQRHGFWGVTYFRGVFVDFCYGPAIDPAARCGVDRKKRRRESRR